jgi:NAD(P)-dependent dehydrogenase (short-subunit alcohol dehydrogenase family)
MPGEFEGKVVLVTGGSAGIGRVTARVFAQQGATVVVAARRVPESEETVALIKAQGGTARFVQTDITQAAAVDALITTTVQTYGRLDCAFNNAGAVGGQHVQTAEFAEEIFDRVIATNVKGTWLCMKYELRQMLAQGDGAIVNCASITGLRGWPRAGVAYCGSKHAVIGMTQTTALEYATAGIRVNAVCPGSVLTEASNYYTMEPAEREARAKGVYPMGRLATPEEVAAAVLWLCSERAAFITGHALPIDGGRLAS